jgi:hypothetical protein
MIGERNFGQSAAGAIKSLPPRPDAVAKAKNEPESEAN